VPYAAARGHDGQRAVGPGGLPPPAAVADDGRVLAELGAAPAGGEHRAQPGSGAQPTGGRMSARELGSPAAKAVPAVRTLGDVRAHLRSALLANHEEIGARGHRRSILRTYPRPAPTPSGILAGNVP